MYFESYKSIRRYFGQQAQIELLSSAGQKYIVYGTDIETQVVSVIDKASVLKNIPDTIKYDMILEARKEHKDASPCGFLCETLFECFSLIIGGAPDKTVVLRLWYNYNNGNTTVIDKLIDISEYV